MVSESNGHALNPQMRCRDVAMAGQNYQRPGQLNRLVMGHIAVSVDPLLRSQLDAQRFGSPLDDGIPPSGSRNASSVRLSSELAHVNTVEQGQSSCRDYSVVRACCRGGDDGENMLSARTVLATISEA
jgi:hypothetical protein